MKLGVIANLRKPELSDAIERLVSWAGINDVELLIAPEVMEHIPTLSESSSIIESSEERMLSSVDFLLAMRVMVGSVPGARVGVWLSHRLRTRSLRGLFGVLVLLVAVGMAYSTFFGRTGGPPVTIGPPEHMSSVLVFIRGFSSGHPVLYGLSAATLALAVGGLVGFLTGRVPAEKAEAA